MKKKLFIATLVAIATLSFASCGQAKTSDSSSTMLVTEQVEVEASINENGDAVLNPDDSNIEIEETESGDKIATIKSEDGSEVKVAVKEDSKGNTVIDTSKVVDSNGNVKKATDDSKTEVKVDSDGTVSVVTTTNNSDEVRPLATTFDSNDKLPPNTIITTYDPTVETPKSITTTYDPTVTPETTTTKTTTAPKATTTTTSKPKETTTTSKTTTTTTTTSKPKETTAPTTTEAPKPTTTKVTTTAHVHSWNPVYKTIEHPAEYATKTIWMYSPLMYDDTKLNAELPYGPNRIIFDNNRDFTRKNDYDLLCYKYGSIYNVPNEYIVEWITKDNYSDYGLSYKEFCRLPMTNYGNGNVVTFNPDLDIFVGIKGSAADPCAYGWGAGSDCWEDEYQAVAQETIKTKDAWTETIVDHYECSCGAHK